MHHSPQAHPSQSENLQCKFHYVIYQLKNLKQFLRNYTPKSQTAGSKARLYSAAYFSSAISPNALPPFHPILNPRYCCLQFPVCAKPFRSLKTFSGSFPAWYVIPQHCSLVPPTNLLRLNSSLTSSLKPFLRLLPPLLLQQRNLNTFTLWSYRKSLTVLICSNVSFLQ